MDARLKPTVVLDTYWRFGAERLAMYLRRLSQPEGPWTTDPILRTYRFTNSFRAADRVSQYLIRNVQYDNGRSPDPAEIIFRTLLFKIFNKIETWELLENQNGPVSWQSFDLDAADDVMHRAMKNGSTIYSAAYIMPMPALGAQKKHSNHLRLLDRLMKDGIAGKILAARSLRELYELLVAIESFGPFLAFQLAIDLNYSSALNFDEAEFVVPGPGALDGISKCFNDLGGMSPTDVIMEMTRVQENEFDRLGLDFPGLFGRRLQPIDCQNLFCEISKYARVAHPEFPGVNKRTQIKQNYHNSLQRIPAPMFPPRWGLTVPKFDDFGNQPLRGQQASLF